jgi:uncharacterized membrane protein
MNKSIGFFGLLTTLSLSACSPNTNEGDLGNGKAAQAIEVPPVSDPANTIFIGVGHDPEWNLAFRLSGFTLRSSIPGLTEIQARLVPAESSANGSIQTYRTRYDQGIMDVEIKGGTCVDAVTGITHPNSTTVTVKRKQDTAPVVFRGCGTFTPR